MNIFESVSNPGHQIEPFHSRLLAVALGSSLSGDRSLFDGVWKLATPDGWNIPKDAEVMAEVSLESGGRTGRIDICILDKPNLRCLGIEVKTSNASAMEGQLEFYAEGLGAKYPDYKLAMAYLTPFNRARAGEMPGSVKAIKIFEAFAGTFPRAQHLSWLDVADISWDGRDLWRQHQEYVRDHISSECHLKRDPVTRDREWDEFFGEEHVQRFWDALTELGIQPGENGTTIELKDFRDALPSFAGKLASAFEILIEAPNVLVGEQKMDEFSEDLRKGFLETGPKSPGWGEGFRQ